MLQHIDGTLIVYQRFFEMVMQGQGYYCSRRWESVASDESVDVFFENPSNSGRDVYLVIIEIVATNLVYVDFYHGNTVVTAGTEIPTYNLNFKYTTQSAFHVEYGGSYTLGTLVHQQMVPGGGAAVRAVGGVADLGEAVVIPPSHNFVLRMTNPSATSIDINMRMIWWEE